MGVLDFAGGLVVHLSAGVGGLVAASVMGRRHGYGTENLSPFDLSLAVVGTGLLWVGWFGFNGGSALAANSRAVMAIIATHLAACAGALTWGALEWTIRRKPSVLGMISGAVAGLGTITPASGFVAPWHGIVIGVIAGLVCFWACTWLKHRFKYDNSLDVFGVHGVGGLTGTLLAGVFATASIGGTSGLIEGNPQQLLIQLYGVAVTLVWSGGVTFVLLKLVSAFVPLRVSRAARAGRPRYFAARRGFAVDPSSHRTREPARRAAFLDLGLSIAHHISMCLCVIHDGNRYFQGAGRSDPPCGVREAGGWAA